MRYGFKRTCKYSKANGSVFDMRHRLLVKSRNVSNHFREPWQRCQSKPGAAPAWTRTSVSCRKCSRLKPRLHFFRGRHGAQHDDPALDDYEHKTRVRRPIGRDFRRIIPKIPPSALSHPVCRYACVEFPARLEPSGVLLRANLLNTGFDCIPSSFPLTHIHA